MTDRSVTKQQRTDQRLRSKIGGFLIEPDTSDGGDTLAIALCSYFEKHLARPKDDPDTENGWGEWVEGRVNATLDALTQELRTLQGEPALTPPPELLGTREPVVTAPQGNAGESPARLLPSKERTLVERLDRILCDPYVANRAMARTIREARDVLSANPSAPETKAPPYLYQCSNPVCGQVWAANPHGHCPACVQPNGSGWSCVCIVPRALPFLCNWPDGCRDRKRCTRAASCQNVLQCEGETDSSEETTKHYCANCGAEGESGSPKYCSADCAEAAMGKRTVGGVPFVIVEDPDMPPDQIELRSANGQVVRLINLALPETQPGEP